MIYTEPYTSDSLFSMQARLSKRNAVLRKNVSGPTPGSYMTTEMRYVPSYEEVVFKGGFASELRGLWKMQNDYMGGEEGEMARLGDETKRRRGGAA